MFRRKKAAPGAHPAAQPPGAAPPTADPAAGTAKGSPAGGNGTGPAGAQATAAASTGAADDRLIGGIDLGGTKIAGAIIDSDHKVISYSKRPTPDRGGPEDVIREMVGTIEEAADGAGIQTSDLRGVGVGAPGSVDALTGSLSGAGNLPNWQGTFPLGDKLSEALGTRVAVGNDVQVATNAEYLLGAGAGYDSLLGVFWGTGVGGGIILDGEPWKGRGRAGEIGHTLVRRGGARALNGLHGTVEAYAGRKSMEDKARREVKKGRKTSLFKVMKKRKKKSLTSTVWWHALKDGDELTEDLLNRAVTALSAGIGSAVNLLDVEAVVIGGGLGVRFADTLVPEIIDGIGTYLLDPENPPDVQVVALGDEGGVIGASLLID